MAHCERCFAPSWTAVIREFFLRCHAQPRGRRSRIRQDTAAICTKNLGGCGEAFVFAATLGYGVDRLLSRLSVISGAEYFITDALASAFAEAACDSAEAEICKGCGGRARFSPGYGDLPLEIQPQILASVDAARRLNITLAKNLMMTPSKSVTAIKGKSDPGTR